MLKFVSFRLFTTPRNDRRCVVTVVVALLSIVAAAATARAQWLDKYPNSTGLYAPTGVQQTADTGYVMAGVVFTGGSFRSPVGWVAKLNSNGTIEWQKNYAGTGGVTLLGMNAIAQTSDSGYVMPVIRGDSSGNPDVASVLKLNFDGTVAWWHHYAPSNPDDARNYFLRELDSIQQTADGGYIAAGPANFQSNSSLGLDVLKLTSSGGSQWSRLLTFNSGSAINAFVQQTSDGGYILAGTRPIPTPSGGQDIFAAKLDTNGNFIWRQFYTGNPAVYQPSGGAACDAQINSVHQTSDGGYFLAGHTHCGTPVNMGPILALKLKSDGSIDWQMGYGATNMTVDSLSAQQTSDGGYILGGRAQINTNGSTAGAFLLKLDADGAITWQRVYAGDSGFSDSVTSIEQTTSGGYIAAVQSFNGNSSFVTKVLNVDANGNIAGCGSASAVAQVPLNFSIIVPNDTNGVIFNNFPLDTTVDSPTATASDAAFSSETLCGVLPAQLEITKTADSSSVTVGQNLTFTIVVKNKGAETAQAVTVTDPLASNLTLASASSTQGNCAQSNGVVTCNMGAIASGAVATVTIVVTPNAAGDISNVATVGGANSQNVQASAKSTASPATNTVQLSTNNYSVGEGDGRVNIIVTRTGDTSGAGTVDYATSDTAAGNSCNVFNGAASSRCDYLATFGTLHFAAGETSKAVPVPIIDDAYAEGKETFAITLSNALGNGMGLGSPIVATITIDDNDTANGVNSIDNSTFFVRQHYLDFLNREPDQSGWDFWTNTISSCGNDQACIEVKRINASAAFFISVEFQQTGFLVYRIYKASFGNLTSPANAPVPIRFAEFLPDTEEIGKGVVVNQGNWQQQLENNKQAFTLEFVQRSRFTAAYAATLTPAQFVDQLFSHAGVTPSSTDRQTAINEFGSATDTSNVNARSRALRDVAENSTFSQQEFNRAFVLMQFFGYLRRNPSDLPDADYSGYNFWLNKLNSFNGDYLKAEMVKAFIDSAEYRQRLGP
jgi:uncharacterized repeat protein (TIGR01451 family)